MRLCAQRIHMQAAQGKLFRDDVVGFVQKGETKKLPCSDFSGDAPSHSRSPSEAGIQARPCLCPDAPAQKLLGI